MVRVYTCSGRIAIVHIAEQTEKNPDYTFTFRQLAEELKVSPQNMKGIVKNLAGHENVKMIQEVIEGRQKNNIYQITKKGIIYAKLIKSQEGLL
ncbi:MAG: hypothetical protein O8C67_04915 [Candidatus Methanoperedens sp.]|nr:hypothetical protein [Candidatus Methanoperedens sp.]